MEEIKPSHVDLNLHKLKKGDIFHFQKQYDYITTLNKQYQKSSPKQQYTLQKDGTCILRFDKDNTCLYIKSDHIQIHKYTWKIVLIGIVNISWNTLPVEVWEALVYEALCKRIRIGQNLSSFNGEKVKDFCVDV